MTKSYLVPEVFKKGASVDEATYVRMYKESIENPDKFWAEQANIIDWFKPFTKVKDTSFELDNFHVKWFEDGELNVSYNCLDRHLEARGDKVAIIWEGDDPKDSEKITYRQLHKEVCKFANCLENLGIKKGDCIVIYLPMLIESAVVMLACTRIGAVHSVVFGGFSSDALANRIIDCKAKLLITADQGSRGGRAFNYKENCDKALSHPEIATIQNVVVIKKSSLNCPWTDERDLWFHDLMKNASDDCAPVSMQAEDPLFVLYTSGSTAKPKGIMHTTGGYLVYAAITYKYVFDHKESDIYWCTADIGWITGHSYCIYGPLANGATTLMFEGIPTYPDASRFWQIVDKHLVTVFYTAPTAIRSLMRFGEEIISKTSRKSLRLLGSVGEPINREAWEWYYNVIGESRCPIMDTWWQTESGGFLITPMPGATELKPSSATLPFFGIKPAIVDQKGNILDGVAEGNLVITDAWPGLARTILNDFPRYLEVYFKTYPGMYLAGDGAKRDEDGYYWITGRVDDVIKVSGHRISTAEVESALGYHPMVVESAVVGFPHDIKGEGIYAYVTLKHDSAPNEQLYQELKDIVRKDIGAIAIPDFIQLAPGLPKTRSGKIMRRILRKVASGDFEDIGDTSTLAEPEVVDDLIKNSMCNM